jgi:hypothetical protein
VQDNPILLARKTLEEVPSQLLNFFRKKGIQPNPPGAVKVKTKFKDFFKFRKSRYMDMMSKKGIEVSYSKKFIDTHGLFSENDHVMLRN